MTVSKLEEEYEKIRQKLDSLNYSEPFRPDSLGLIKRLLQDLVVTTHSYKDMREQIHKIDMQYRDSLNQVEPLKKQVQALTQENNHLHHQMVLVSELKEDTESKCLRQLKRMESQLSDVNFLKSHLMSYYENEKLELEKQLQYKHDLTRGFGVATVEEAMNHLPKVEFETGLSKKIYDRFLKQGPLSVQVIGPQKDSAFLDMAKVYDARIEELNKQILTFRNREQEHENQIQRLTEQLNRRNEELGRLQSVVDESQPYYKSIGANSQNNVQITSNNEVERLNLQIEYLQERHLSFDKELNESKVEKEQLIEKFEKEKIQLMNDIELEKERNKEIMVYVNDLEMTVDDLKNEFERRKKKNSEVKKTTEELKGKLQKPKVKSKEPLQEQNSKRPSVEIPKKVLLKTSEAQTDKILLQSDIQKYEDLLETSEHNFQQLKSHYQELEQVNYKLEEDLMKKSSDEKKANELREQVLNEKDDLIDQQKGIIYQKNHLIEELNTIIQDKNELIERGEKLILELKEQRQANLSEKVTIISKDEFVEAKDFSDSYKMTLERFTQTETHTPEREILFEQVNIHDFDRKRIEEKYLALQGDYKILKHRYEQTTSELNKIRNELKEKKEMYAQIDNLIEKMNQRKIEQDAQIEKLSNENYQLQLALDQFNMESKETDFSVKNLIRDVDNYKAQIKKMDLERDELILELDSKEEQLVDLSKMCEELMDNLTKIQAQNDSSLKNQSIMNNHLAEQDNEIENLRRQIGTLNEERSKVTRELQAVNENLRKAQNEAMILSKENHLVNSDLSNALELIHSKEEELKRVHSQVVYFEDLAKSKEQEKEMILTAYKQNMNEIDSLKDIIHNHEKQKINDLNVKNEMEHVETLFHSLEKELDEAKIIIRTQEQQNENLTKTLNSFSHQQQQSEKEKALLMDEIETIKKTLMLLERSKDASDKQIARVSIENEHLKSALDTMKTEKEASQHQLAIEKSRIERLEQLVALERTRKMQSEASQQALVSIKEKLTQQVDELNEDQKQRLEKLQEENLVFKRENDRLLDKVRELETYRKDVDSELLGMRQQLEEISLINNEAEFKAANQSVLIPPVPPTPGSLERKILTELEITKKQLEKYETELDQKQKRDSNELTTKLIHEWQVHNDHLKQEILAGNYSTGSGSPNVNATPRGGNTDEHNRILMSVVQQVKKDLKRSHSTSPTQQETTSQQQRNT